MKLKLHCFVFIACNENFKILILPMIIFLSDQPIAVSVSVPTQTSFAYSLHLIFIYSTIRSNIRKGLREELL